MKEKIKEKRKPEVDKSMMTENPFMVDKEIPTKDIAKKVLTVNKVDNNYYPTGATIEIRVVDVGRTTKTYHSSEHKKLILTLPDDAIRVLKYIEYSLAPGYDFLFLNELNYKLITGKSIRSFREAVKVLVSRSIICPSKYKSTFFINPMIMFCGSRVNKYPKHKITK